MYQMQQCVNMHEKQCVFFHQEQQCVIILRESCVIIHQKQKCVDRTLLLLINNKGSISEL